MAYAGYLIKIHGGSADYDIPLSYINEKSYKGTLSTLDLDSLRDGNGVLHRNAVLQVPHCSFNTRALTDLDIDELWGNLQSRYINGMEKKVLATIYISETTSYYTGSFYIPDTEMTINHISNGRVHYEPITFEFIGYGE